MTEYRNVPEQYSKFKKPFIKVLGIFLIPLAILVLFLFFNESRGIDFFKKDVYFLLVIFSIGFCFAYYLVNRRQKKAYYSYRLIIGADYLTRRQSELPDMTVSFKDIVAVSEYQGGLLIQSGEKGKTLIVWPYIDNYEGVKELLSSLHPIAVFDYKTLFLKYPFLLSIVMIIGMASTYISSNKIVVAIGAAVALGIMSWLYYRTRSLKHTDAGLKKSAWLYILLAFILIMNLLVKLSA
jgi:hypothetical protein